MFESGYTHSPRRSPMLDGKCLAVIFVFVFSTGWVYAQDRDIESRIAEIKQQIEAMENDNKQLRSEIEARESRIKEMRREIEQLDKKLEEARASMESES